MTVIGSRSNGPNSAPIPSNGIEGTDVGGVPTLLTEPEPCAQYNPKEISIDKSVPWLAATNPALKYTFFIPDGTPCARAVTLPTQDGSSKDPCALAAVSAFRPVEGLDSETEIVDFNSTTKPHADGLLLD